MITVKLTENQVMILRRALYDHKNALRRDMASEENVPRGVLHDTIAYYRWKWLEIAATKRLLKKLARKLAEVPE